MKAHRLDQQTGSGFGWILVVLALAMSAPCRAASPQAAGHATRGNDATWINAASRIPADWLVDSRPFKAAITRTLDGKEISLENGLIRRTFRLTPNGATVALDNLVTGASLLRGIKPEALVTLNGREYGIGGLAGQPDYAYLLPEWVDRLANNPAAFGLSRCQTGLVQAPMKWQRKRHAENLPWPRPGAALDFFYSGPDEVSRPIEVHIHYELYDGLPVMGKWLAISNGSAQAITVNRFTSELLAAVEAESVVDTRESGQWRLPAVDVLSDYMFKGGDHLTANRVAFWEPDPQYTTQVNYELKAPVLLACRPPYGPGVTLQPGEVLRSFRVYLVLHDSTDRERQGLAVRRAMRALAPWCTENPLMMHVRSADSRAFRDAVDQCAAVGFEMIVYTFGSGINLESEDPDYLGRVRRDVDYAHAKGLEVGAYSLFSSRRIDDDNDVINPTTGKPGGAVFGQAPCLASVWGTNYLRKLIRFIDQTGLDLIEHDGPYPGDVCGSTRHPLHQGKEDSQWVQWRLSANFYTWCREQGIYVNQPDFYFLCGGNKTAMGYREVNWSLPRAQQIIHARQNIFDGTWTKTPTMGWMFVPLTEYHGGGAAATLEPLGEHLAEYEAHLANTLGAGVQACWRGPRLYDSEATRLMVTQWVRWFKRHRDILESDVVHGRRADGRDIDWFLHVNPSLAECGLAMIYNPLPRAVETHLSLPLYYTGLTDRAKIRLEGGRSRTVKLDRNFSITVAVRVPANRWTWLGIEKP